MKALFIALLELALLVGIVAAVLYHSSVLDWAVGMPSADERLLNAAWDGDELLVDQALDDGASIQARSVDGSSALDYAAWGGHAALIEQLIGLGIDVDSSDRNGITPLMYAASNDHDQVVQILLKHGADPRRQASSGPFDAFDMAEKRTGARTLAVLRQWEQGAQEAAREWPAQNQRRLPADAARWIYLCPERATVPAAKQHTADSRPPGVDAH